MSELDWSVDGALEGVVVVDVSLALVTVSFEPVDTKLGQETSNVLHELDGLLPGADVLVHTVEHVSDASTSELH